MANDMTTIIKVFVFVSAVASSVVFVLLVQVTGKDGPVKIGFLQKI